MQTVSVMCRRAMAASARRVWDVVGQFQSEWHPAVMSCRAEIISGSEFRVMALRDGTEMRERLTWFSATERSFAYEMVAGIEGCARYVARVDVSPNGSGSEIVWQARITANDDRVQAIATGTRAIFEAGFDALEDLCLGEPADEEAPEAQQAAPVTRTFVDALSLLTTTGSGGTLVLCLHGIGGQAANWQAQLERFGGEHAIAALDLRGYGQSAPGGGQTRVEDHCTDILAVAKAVNARKLVLVGLSMGAWIATSFAMRHSDRLAGLVLAGGCTGMSEASPQTRRGFLTSRAQPLQQGKTPADIAPSVVDVIAGPNATREHRATLQGSMAEISTQTYLDALSCFCTPTERFDFAKITCPVLMLTGEHDRLAPPDEIRSVAARIHHAMVHSDVRFETIPGAGHVCNLEAPAVFNTHLARFVSRVG